MAERTRFERVRPCGPTAFKAVAIIRSATSPSQRRRGGSNSHACYRARPPTECPTIRRRLPGAGYRTRTPVDGLGSRCLATRSIPRSGPWESNPSGAAWKAAASPLGQTRDPSVVIGPIRSPALSCVYVHRSCTITDGVLAPPRTFASLPEGGGVLLRLRLARPGSGPSTSDQPSLRPAEESNLASRLRRPSWWIRTAGRWHRVHESNAAAQVLEARLLPEHPAKQKGRRIFFACGLCLSPTFRWRLSPGATS